MSEATETAAMDAIPDEPLRPGPLYRFWRHPITQLVVRIVVFAVIAGLFGYLMRLVLQLPKYEGEGAMAATLTETGATPWLRQLRGLLPLVLAYVVMVAVMERRPVSEFAPRKALPHLATGWLLGMGILLAAAAALAVPGFYKILGFNPDAKLLAPFLVLGLGAGVGEEIVSRGILFRVVEDCFGTWAALLFSAALFGLGHISNPNATWWSSLAIAVEAGLLLGMAFAWTRSLWFVIALHAAWNFTQGPLLGIAVSGIAVDGLLKSTLTGPPMLSGGEFGAEASIFTLVICVSVAVFFARRAWASGRIYAPQVGVRATLMVGAVGLAIAALGFAFSSIPMLMKALFGVGLSLAGFSALCYLARFIPTPPPSAERQSGNT
jgi:membrane protease YdiL (CAAX protease family)